MYFSGNQDSGSRLVGAITKFGELGPKHHGLIIGEGAYDGNTYVAESMGHGYQYVTIDEFVSRYKLNGKIKRYQNDCGLSGFEVAKRAVDEINNGGNGKYNLVSNNCESFVNRALHGHSVSWQVVRTLILAVGVGVGVFMYKKGGKAA